MSCKPSVTLQPWVREETHAAAVAELYDHHHAWLVHWLRRRLNGSHVAPDLAQDVFVRLLTRRQVISREQPRAFLSTIARGLVIDFWRRREVEQAWLEVQQQLPAAEAPSPEESLVFLEALLELDRLLHELKPKVRAAFMLARFQGLTCPEIAARLGVSLATVERYLAAALRHCYAACYPA